MTSLGRLSAPEEVARAQQAEDVVAQLVVGHEQALALGPHARPQPVPAAHVTMTAAAKGSTPRKRSVRARPLPAATVGSLSEARLGQARPAGALHTTAPAHHSGARAPVVVGALWAGVEGVLLPELRQEGLHARAARQVVLQPLAVQHQQHLGARVPRRDLRRGSSSSSSVHAGTCTCAPVLRVPCAFARLRTARRPTSPVAVGCRLQARRGVQNICKSSTWQVHPHHVCRLAGDAIPSGAARGDDASVPRGAHLGVHGADLRPAEVGLVKVLAAPAEGHVGAVNHHVKRPVLVVPAGTAGTAQGGASKRSAPERWPQVTEHWAAPGTCQGGEPAAPGACRRSAPKGGARRARTT